MQYALGRLHSLEASKVIQIQTNEDDKTSRMKKYKLKKATERQKR